MKTFILFVIVGAIIGAGAWGEEGVITGAGGGFVFWVFIKIVGYLNRHTDKISDAFDDD